MSELQRLRDRVAELEGALGLTAKVPHDLIPQELIGVHRTGTPAVRRFIGMLLTRPFGSREAIYSTFYGGLPEADQPGERILDVYITAARKVLTPHGITIQTIRKQGWLIDPENKRRLRALIEKLNGNQQQNAA